MSSQCCVRVSVLPSLCLNHMINFTAIQINIETLEIASIPNFQFPNVSDNIVKARTYEVGAALPSFNFRS
jgi:hypothetical protein